uniref:Uncharacterized protein n=1 Tax=Panagrolaimus davidi TaxID=227884 RepID=A0A914P6E0_9BILA
MVNPMYHNGTNNYVFKDIDEDYGFETQSSISSEDDSKFEMARMESVNVGSAGDQSCLSPMSPIDVSGLMVNEFDNRAVSPQHVDLHTFRDAIDVNYQRMAITGEELSGVPLEDLRSAALLLIEALNLRRDYMERIGNYFPSTTRDFLSGHYPKNLPKYRRKNTESFQLLHYSMPQFMNALMFTL